MLTKRFSHQSVQLHCNCNYQKHTGAIPVTIRLCHDTKPRLSYRVSPRANLLPVILAVSFVLRYAGLYFCICVDISDNNLFYLEAIHNFVEVEAVTVISDTVDILTDPV